MDVSYCIILLLIVLVSAVSLYWTVVPRLIFDWWSDPNFSHGFLVPVYSVFMIWKRRERLRVFSSNDANLPGILFVLLGSLLLILGKAGGEYFTMRISIVFVIGGIFRIVFGKKGFRECLFPIAFLFFMVPIPYLIYESVAFPLKIGASWIGEHSLMAFGVPVFREGNVLSLANLKLEVADACSGIRSMMSMLTLSAAVAYCMETGLIKGGVLIVAGIPISMLANSARIILTGIVSNHFGVEYASGYFHEISGVIIFLLAAAALFSAGYLLRGRYRYKSSGPGRSDKESQQDFMNQQNRRD